jgi:hypothetical protein
MCTAFLAPLQGAIHFPRSTGGGASLENAPLACDYFLEEQRIRYQRLIHIRVLSLWLLAT